MPEPPASRIRTVPVPGAEISTQQQGDGPDVVLIAGLGDCHEAWTDLAAVLSPRYRVITLDNRGIGYSPLGSEPLSIDLFAGDVAAVLAAWGTDHAHIVGSSMGGAIAQALAEARPGTVDSLTLVGTWRAPDPHLSRLLGHLGCLVELIDDPRELLGAMALWVYSSRAHGDGTAERLIGDSLASELPEQSADAFIATARAAVAHDMGDRLASLAAPTLILVGDEDRICPPALSRDLHNTISGSRLHVLPGRGHQPFQEDADEFAAELEAFWSGL